MDFFYIFIYFRLNDSNEARGFFFLNKLFLSKYSIFHIIIFFFFILTFHKRHKKIFDLRKNAACYWKERKLNVYKMHWGQTRAKVFVSYRLPIVYLYIHRCSCMNPNCTLRIRKYIHSHILNTSKYSCIRMRTRGVVILYLRFSIVILHFAEESVYSGTPENHIYLLYGYVE